MKFKGSILVACLLVLAGKPASADPPNIIFILIDDMGYADLSAFRNGPVRTPNIDRLAHEGIRFTDFYVASPICSPSRVALISGQYPVRHGFHSYLDNRQKNARRHMPDYLDPGVATIAGTLKKAGYATAHFGKWHMGGGRDVGAAPLDRKSTRLNYSH